MCTTNSFRHYFLKRSHFDTSSTMISKLVQNVLGWQIRTTRRHQITYAQESIQVWLKKRVLVELINFTNNIRTLSLWILKTMTLLVYHQYLTWYWCHCWGSVKIIIQGLSTLSVLWGTNWLFCTFFIIELTLLKIAIRSK